MSRDYVNLIPWLISRQGGGASQSRGARPAAALLRLVEKTPYSYEYALTKKEEQFFLSGGCGLPWVRFLGTFCSFSGGFPNLVSYEYV